MQYRALATDYDGTIAHDSAVDPATLAALQRAKAAGIQLILITGRELQGVYDVLPQWWIFDYIVAENGALLFDLAKGTSRPISPPPPPEFIERLRAQNVPISFGQSIVSTYEPHGRVMQQAIDELQMDWQIIMNKTAVMALPRGMDKAAGLRALLAEIEVDAEQVVAVGDAENDLAFMQMCGYPVAVANAIPAVKTIAKWVTPSARGAGVAELIDRLIEEIDDTSDTPSIADA